LPTIKPTETMNEKAFREYRISGIYEINLVTYWVVAGVLVLFNTWDWYLDPVHAPQALAIRLAGAAIIIIGGVVQKRSASVAAAPWIAKLRTTASAGAIAGALMVLDSGFVYGLAGLIGALLGSSYLAMNRKDLLVLYLPSILLAVIMMIGIDVERFVFINAMVFLAMTLVIGLLLTSVLENSFRKSFQLEQALLRESRTDSLTNVPNRRSLEELATHALQQAKRSQQPVSLLLIDIDHFKPVNDEYGHDVGDRVLKMIADHCIALVRESEFFGRWGGEEFLAILPATTTEQAIKIADRMRTDVAGIKFEEPGISLRLTVSIGVASVVLSTDNNASLVWKSLLKDADGALYRAKATGRNRIEAATA
jgi:diguanylate cyclase (GGDEF)-like protein